MPVENLLRLRGAFELVQQLAYPMGSVRLLGVAAPEDREEMQTRLLDSQTALMKDGVFASATVIESGRFPDDVKLGLQAMAGSFFRPNLLFLQLPKDKETHRPLEGVLKEAKRQRVGVALLGALRSRGAGTASKNQSLDPGPGL